MRLKEILQDDVRRKINRMKVIDEKYFELMLKTERLERQ